MPDFSHLLRRPAGQAEKPKALPIGDYPGIISAVPTAGESAQQKTPFVRIPVKLVDWAPGITEEEMLTDKGERIDLSKKNFRRDYYLTDDALFRLDDLIASCGLAVTDGQTYDELLPQLVGKNVVVALTHYTNNKTGEIGNDVKALTGTGD